MKLAVGIDTGGTCTDAVVFDCTEKKILASTKVLTTKEDLSIGVINALNRLDPALLREAEMIGLSTTLATNACVENKGGRAKLLMLGVDRQTASAVGGEYGLTDPARIWFLSAKTSPEGHIVSQPDFTQFLADGSDWLSDAEALAIVDRDAMENGGALEQAACDAVRQVYDIPIICGHELFADLNALKRGAGVLLNAQLIPVIAAFLDAVRTALRAKGITAPVAIVRSDGSLMSERFTGARPVETLLCGPAASVVGGHALSGERHSFIIDMGGTTTDIAMVRDGLPVRTTGGIAIGGWRTSVKGVYVETIGLGGDSAVGFDRYGRFILSATRVIPLAVAAYRWPVIVDKLRALLAEKTNHTRPLHHFFTRVKGISNSPHFTAIEKAFCAALEGGPLSYAEAAAVMGTDVYNFRIDRLEREGIVLRCGLTPTDIMHIKGDYNDYCAEASRLGAGFAAASAEMDVQTLCDTVYDNVKRKLFRLIARLLLKEHASETLSDTLIDGAWDAAQKNNPGAFPMRFTTDAVLVGVGAPVHVFLPDVARALGTRCFVPEMAGVVNALGAVAGHVASEFTVTIKPDESGGYRLFGGPVEPPVEDLDEAIEKARAIAARAAEQEAIRRGAAGDITVNVTVKPLVALTSYQTEIFLASSVTATAMGGKLIGVSSHDL